MIEVKNLSKSFGELKAVDGISFSIEPGVCVGLLGKNGAGKTTAVEMMEGITDPDSGEILYRGAPPGPNFKNEAGIMFQSTAIQEFVTCKEMLRMFGMLYPKTVDAEKLVELCDLKDFLKRDAKKLSGGQKQRLLLAIALINDPRILFLDEPSTGLDPNARRKVWKIINDLKAEGKTIVLTTHYMDEAYELCDRIMIMDAGKIIAEGSPVELLSNRFEDSVIELPLKDLPDPKQFSGLVRDKDLARIYSRDVNGDVARLLENGASLSNLRIRSRNLEDLFLDITSEEPLSESA